MRTLYKKILYSIGLMLVGFAIGILVNIPSCQKQKSHIEYITVHDTTFIPQERIVEKTKKVFITKIDSFYVKTPGDTVYIQSIPIEYKEYRDTFNTDTTSAKLKINYHGWNSDIDSIRLDYSYNNTREVIVQPPKKFGFDLVIGPYVGYGVNLTPTNPIQANHGFEIGIGVMVGIGYRIK